MEVSLSEGQMGSDPTYRKTYQSQQELLANSHQINVVETDETTQALWK